MALISKVSQSATLATLFLSRGTAIFIIAIRLSCFVIVRAHPIGERGTIDLLCVCEVLGVRAHNLSAREYFGGEDARAHEGMEWVRPLACLSYILGTLLYIYVSP